jgi:hypothetical protein
MKPRATKPEAKGASRGGWSGGPVKDNPGDRRFALFIGALFVACAFIALH